MERFQSIDWHPSLTDIISNVFISEERLQEEGVMYKILRGNFIDPFNDTDMGYEDVKLELLDDTVDEKNKESQEEQSPVTDETKDTQNRTYVPGIVKVPFRFPRASHLNKEQHATCLRVMLRFSSSEKPEMSQKDREDVKVYMDLKDIINQEQTEYLEFAKSKWNDSKLKLKCEDYINSRWRYKFKYLENIPRYYSECIDIPFVDDHEIRLQYISTLLHMGKVAQIVLPTFNRPYKLFVNANELEQAFPTIHCINNDSVPFAKLPVSQDPKCEELAVTNDVDIVISSGGLNALLNNLDPNYSNSWIVPVVVKTYNGKNIVYIDKPLPPTSNTIIQKNNWVYKYILRRFLIRKKNTNLKNLESRIISYDDDIFDITSDTILKFEDEYERDFKGFSNNSLGDHSYVKQTCTRHDSDEKEENMNNHTKNVNLIHGENNDNGSCEDTKDYMNIGPNGWNVSYKLFNISPQPTEQSELMKNNIVKEYKILVRSKVDGIQKLPKQNIQFMMLAPKLEHQIGFGAEAVTLDEALRQWISIAFRPGASLARVRIAAETSEILQVEKRTMASINNELKRLYGVKAEDSLKILYNVAQKLTNVNPGTYIIRHTIRNGAFAKVYKEVNSSGKNVFDLRSIYTDEFQTIPHTPWPALDKTVATPLHKCFERMPAMFFPTKKNNVITKKPITKRKKKNKNVDPGVLRKSLRINKRLSLE